MENEIRIPYTQQFSPEQTPIKKLLDILEECKKSPLNLKQKIAETFFSKKADPKKLAGNTLISLKTHNIIDNKNNLTDFGLKLLSLKENISDVVKEIAKNILINLNCVVLIETIREMNSANLKIKLTTLPDELTARGITASRNSSDLSGVMGWLKLANIIDKTYNVNEIEYEKLIGVNAKSLDALKDLNHAQIAFLKSIVALSISDWTPYNNICTYAEQLYWGEFKYNWKMIVKEVLQPLEKIGYIEIKKKGKKDVSLPEGRGGKVADIKPTQKLSKEISEPLLDILYKSAGFSDLRKIRSMSLADIISDIKQKEDVNKKGSALELLTIRICQMLDLEFDKWRETDENVTAGGEVDAMLHSSRLIYSRWQIQCKASDISLEAIAKEVGMNAVTLANVILIVGTGKATESALKYRKRIVSNSNLNIIILEGKHLADIIAAPSSLVDHLNKQASDAMRSKPNEVIGNKSPNYYNSLISSEEEFKDITESALDFKPCFSTNFGQMYCGDSLEVMPYLIQEGIRAKLIMTSPPFALIKKKEYGNMDADDYIDWFMDFIPYFKQILEPTGSLVIDIGGSWIKGIPAKSIYQYKLLMKLCENGFYLAQEFYHYNPAKLPTPAEWVTIRRMRVKDAVNNVWWLVLDPFMDADNRKILKPYSESMKNLIKNGYTRNVRPSGHDISDKFQKDNGGAIPSNLIEIANTESNSYYIKKCKENNIKPHPARFPSDLPEFFIKFLTNEGELVLDPFAGSNVTGYASEKLKRKWIGIEMNYEYIAGSKFRFDDDENTDNTLF